MTGIDRMRNKKGGVIGKWKRERDIGERERDKIRKREEGEREKKSETLKREGEIMIKLGRRGMVNWKEGFKIICKEKPILEEKECQYSMKMVWRQRKGREGKEERDRGRERDTEKKRWQKWLSVSLIDKLNSNLNITYLFLFLSFLSFLSSLSSSSSSSFQYLVYIFFLCSQILTDHFQGTGVYSYGAFEFRRISPEVSILKKLCSPLVEPKTYFIHLLSSKLWWTT